MPTPTTQPIAYFEGVLDVYYALMTAEDTATTAATYGTPEVLGRSIEVTVTPRYVEGSLYASNVAVRRVKKIDGYDVSLNLDQVLAAAKKAVLGRTADTNGVQAIGDSANPPYCAIAFAVTKDNGEKELWWLLKGKFAEMEKSAKTRGESIEYQTPTLEGVFDRRFDGLCAYVVETDDPDIGTGVESGWFSEVYEPSNA